jgi:hypothetical protein
MPHKITTIHGVKIVHINSQVHPRDSHSPMQSLGICRRLGSTKSGRNRKIHCACTADCSYLSILAHLSEGKFYMLSPTSRSFVHHFSFPRRTLFLSLPRHPSRRLRLRRRIYLGVHHNKSHQPKVLATLSYIWMVK